MSPTARQKYKELQEVCKGNVIKIWFVCYLQQSSLVLESNQGQMLSCATLHTNPCYELCSYCEETCTKELVPDSRFTGMKLGFFGISTATGDETFTCWYILFAVVTDWCFTAPYDAAAFLPRSVHKHNDTRDKHAVDQRPPQSTAQLLSEPCVKGQSWDPRVRMGRKRRDGLGHNIQFGLERNGLQNVHQIVRHSAEKHTQRLDTPVQVQGTATCSVGPEEAQPAMPRGWKLQLKEQLSAWSKD